MALRFMDGFDHYDTMAVLLQKWSEVSSLPSFSIVTGMDSIGNALQCGTNGFHVRKVLDAQTTWIVGFWVRFTTTLTNARIIRLFDTLGNATQVELRLNSDGTLSITRNGTALTSGTSTNQVLINTWYFMEWKMTISTSIPANSCELRVNGNNWITVATGQNTRNTSNTNADAVDFLSDMNGVQLDHFYILDSTGSSRNDFLGPRRIKTAYPAADSGTTTFIGSDGNSVNNWALIDETPVSTVDYVTSAVSGDIDLYTLTSLALGDTIDGIQVSTYSNKTSAGSAKQQIIVRPTSTNYFSSDFYLSNSTGYYSYIREQNPDTSSNWTVSQINNLIVGIKNNT